MELFVDLFGDLFVGFFVGFFVGLFVDLIGGGGGRGGGGSIGAVWIHFFSSASTRFVNASSWATSQREEDADAKLPEVDIIK